MKANEKQKKKKKKKKKKIGKKSVRKGSTGKDLFSKFRITKYFQIKNIIAVGSLVLIVI